MYVYRFNFVNYDDFDFAFFQSKIKYTKEQLYEILYDVLYEIYKEEEHPPLPCLLNWGDVLSYMNQEPYKSWLRKKYFLASFDFDKNINLEGSPSLEKQDNLRCDYKDDTESTYVDCLFRHNHCKILRD